MRGKRKRRTAAEENIWQTKRDRDGCAHPDHNCIPTIPRQSPVYKQTTTQPLDQRLDHSWASHFLTSGDCSEFINYCFFVSYPFSSSCTKDVTSASQLVYQEGNR